MGLPERLKEVQSLMTKGDERAAKIYETIGVHLGCALAQHADFYDYESALILGRVTTGEGGDLVIDKATKVLKANFPEVARKIELRVPDEKSRRVGQAVAAASLPARLLGKIIREKPAAAMGLATGSTMEPLYRELVALKLDWHKLTTFNLDEYIGISPLHPQSYHSFMWEKLFQHVNISIKNVHIPDGLAKDVPAACDHYEQKILAAGGIDLQLLGIGTSGHIGFNEPTSSLASRTRIKTLTPQTRSDNARFFESENEVPFHVITMGIGTILESRHCVLLAFGSKKARAIAEAVEGPITAMNPASALQLHPKVTVILDEEAAADLKMKDYYRWVYEQKLDWQKI